MVTARWNAHGVAGLLAMAFLASGCDVIFGIEDGELQPVTIVPVVDNVKGEVTWTADTVRSLQRIILVESGATLTIEPGTTILAEKNSALVVLRGGRIIACGEVDAPIVFTSAGSPRAPGDWGGVVLLGDAQAIGSPVAADEISPTDVNNAITTFGGMQDDSNSGQLCYVRIEFAGAAITTTHEFPALGLYGTGSGTEVHHVQVHASADDGMKIAGGKVDVRYVLATRNGDGMKWELGWRGHAQFIGVVMGGAGETYGDGLHGEEDGDLLASPVSRPSVYNVTVLGHPATGNGTSAGLLLSKGMKGLVSNALIDDYAGLSFDVQDPETIPNTADGSLDVTYSIFASINNFDEQIADNDMGNFDEQVWALESTRMNKEALPLDVGIKGTELESLDLSLKSGSPALTSGRAPPSPFDASATYVGACGETCPEFEGWTAFPQK